MEQGVPLRSVWYVIGVLFVVNVVNYIDRMALAVLLPAIKVDLALSDAQLGLLIGFAFSVFYAICGIPIARWADRGVRRDVIAAALATWSVMTALSGAAQNFWQLFLARMGIGAGEAGCLPPSQSIICDCVPPGRRPGVYAVHTFGLIVGMMLGMALAGSLAEAIGWRMTFVALGLPGIALAFVVRTTLREPVRGFFDTTKSRAGVLPLAGTVRVLWHCQTYRLLVLFLAVSGFANFGLLQWWPSLYMRIFGLNLATVGVQLGIAVGAGSGLGLLLGGLMAGKSSGRDLKLPLLIGAAAMLLALPAAAASLFAPSRSASMMFVALTALLWSVANGPVVATMYGVVSADMRATAGAISIFLTSVIGQGLGPFCVGSLSDTLMSSVGSQALRYALLAPVSLLPVMVVLLYIAAKQGAESRRSTGCSMK